MQVKFWGMFDCCSFHAGRPSRCFSDVSPSRGYPEAGMSFGDSKAVFKQRAMAMGMEEAVFRAFDRDGINTMATFAFACNYAPGASSDTPLVEIIKKILGRDPTTLEMRWHVVCLTKATLTLLQT